MPAKQPSRSEEPPMTEQTFSDVPTSPLQSVASQEEMVDAPLPPPPAPDVSPAVSGEAAADFFLSCMDVVEQQKFLGFCETRQLSPAAGIALFLKEPLQKDELDPMRANPFADEAQAMVDSMRPTASTSAHSQLIAPPSQNLPVKPCAVCGTMFPVKFRGRMLCENPTCWHTYAGISPQQPRGVGAGTGELADTTRRLGKLESMMERVAGAQDRLAAMLDRMVGAR